MPKIIKEAFKKAVEEKEEEKIKYYKEIIKKYLNELEALQKQHRDVVRRMQILKRDIKDLSQGRLDRIQERQKIDPIAAEVSVLKIEPSDSQTATNWYTSVPCSWTYSATGTSSGTTQMTTDSITLTGKFCSMNTSGAYELDSGVIKHIQLTINLKLWDGQQTDFYSKMLMKQ